MVSLLSTSTPRPSSGFWYINRSSDKGLTVVPWGSNANNEVPLPGDFDGDGITEIAVWRPANGVWYIYRSSDGGMTAAQWGMDGDVPIK